MGIGARAPRPQQADEKYGNAGETPALQQDGEKCGRDARAPASKYWHSRGYLPHCDVPGLLQFITFRLADSLPADTFEGLCQDSDERNSRIEELLDAGHGECLLQHPEVAAIVENALLHFDGQRYLLLAWCVMPNHVHLLIQTREEWNLSDLLHGWKSFTSHAINSHLGRNGAVWMADYFDRYIRDDLHLAAVIEYIHGNPVKARLVDDADAWSYSSAGARASRPHDIDNMFENCGRDARAPTGTTP